MTIVLTKICTTLFFVVVIISHSNDLKTSNNTKSENVRILKFRVSNHYVFAINLGKVSVFDAVSLYMEALYEAKIVKALGLLVILYTWTYKPLYLSLKQMNLLILILLFTR